MSDDQFLRLIKKAKQLQFKRFDLAWNWLTYEPAAGDERRGFQLHGAAPAPVAARGSPQDRAAYGNDHDQRDAELNSIMTPYWTNGPATLYHADARQIPLPDGSVHCCVMTSPPYWGLRDYGLDAGIGTEPTLAEHIENLVAVMREIRRVLRDDGTVWLNYGDA